MSNSRLTSKFQATIPQDIRAILDLKAGDRIIFEITKDNHVKIKKATPLDLIYLKSLESTLSEWSSKNDEEDYGDL
jgi:AbrB family looped-hinge helix DNA binding protein